MKLTVLIVLLPIFLFSSLKATQDEQLTWREIKLVSLKKPSKYIRGKTLKKILFDSLPEKIKPKIIKIEAAFPVVIDSSCQKQWDVLSFEDKLAFYKERAGGHFLSPDEFSQYEGHLRVIFESPLFVPDYSYTSEGFKLSSMPYIIQGHQVYEAAAFIHKSVINAVRFYRFAEQSKRLDELEKSLTKFSFE